MADCSFDVVSKIDLQEVSNAVAQTMKEIKTRFDFKGSVSDVTLDKEGISIISDDAYKLKSVHDILEQKLVKRSVPLKGLTFEKVEQAAGSTVRQRVTLQQGIPTDKAKEIVRVVKDSKMKVQASIMGDYVRIGGRDRDVLQSVIELLRGTDFGVDMRFTNYRNK